MADQHFILTTTVLPWPADQGSKLFQLEVARGLLELGPVHWITREIGEQAAAIAKLTDEGFDLRLDSSFRGQSVIARAKRRVSHDLRARTTGVTREEGFVCTPGVRQRVATAHAEFPDAVGVAAYWSATPVLELAPAGRRVFVVADIDSARSGRGGALDNARGVSPAVAAAERRAFNRADLALLLTGDDEDDAHALLGDAAAPVFGRCPVSLEIPASPPPPPSRGDLLLYGHWEADFNRDGLLWFLREIWPGLQRHPSKPSLRIVGKGIPGGVGGPGIECVGYVEDLEAELAQCRAVLIPLRYASGLRYRLLEAFAHGRPVIATGVAAGGSGAEEGRHFYRAEAVGEWAAALDALDDADLPANALAWVRQHYSREGLARRWSNALAPILSA